MLREIDTESFGFLTTDLARLIKAEFDRRIAATGIGLTAGEARTLVHAARAGKARQAVLAERMGIEAMTISTFIDRLEQRGLLKRMPDPADKRANLVVLTDAADPVLKEIRAVAAAVRDDASRGFEPGTWAALIAGLKSARANLADVRDAATRRASDAA